MKINYKPNSELEKFGVKVYSALVENFPQTFFVGGMVRDLLFKQKITDIDIATSARPQEIIAVLKKNAIFFDDSARKYGLIKAKQLESSLEVASFRKDFYTNSRYPVISFVKTAKEDSRRRDFTVNSLYFSQKTGKILDFYKGLWDINKKILRFIGNESKRVLEDPLRIVRALRFALLLELHIEERSYRAIKNNFSLLKKLTQNKIQNEISKLRNKKQETILKKVINNPEALDKYFRKR